MTPHISAKKEEIAKTVFLAGDPLRAKFIAENYLENYKLVSGIRGIFFFTGTYKGKEVTVGASGMGFGSMGIYAFELYHFYEVERIIRIGTTGSYRVDLKNYELVLCEETIVTCPCFGVNNGCDDIKILKPTKELNAKLEESAANKGIKLNKGRVFSNDVFYIATPVQEIISQTQAICVEMESYALFSVARRLNKEAACILTVSDNVITTVEISPIERERSVVNMIEVALDIL